MVTHKTFYLFKFLSVGSCLKYMGKQELDLWLGNYFLLRSRVTQEFVVDGVQASYPNLDQASSDGKAVVAAVCV